MDSILPENDRSWQLADIASVGLVNATALGPAATERSDAAACIMDFDGFVRHTRRSSQAVLSRRFLSARAGRGYPTIASNAVRPGRVPAATASTAGGSVRHTAGGHKALPYQGPRTAPFREHAGQSGGSRPGVRRSTRPGQARLPDDRVELHEAPTADRDRADGLLGSSPPRRELIPGAQHAHDRSRHRRPAALGPG